MGRCECGCGRDVALGASRASGRAVYISSMLPGIEHLEKCRSAKGRNTRELKAFIDRGQRYSWDILVVCHDSGYAKFMPSSQEVSDWEVKALALIRDLYNVDPSWVKTWRGPSAKGPLPTPELDGGALTGDL